MNANSSDTWIRTLLQKLFWLLLGCVLAGLLTGQLAWCLALGMGLYLVWTLRQMLRFHHWLRHHPKQPPPEARGIWGEIFDSIYHLQRNDARMRTRMQSVIDRVQSSTAALRDAVVMIDRKGDLEWWNPAAEQLLGLRAPDDSGQHVTNLIRDPRFVDYFELQNYSESLTIPSPVDESHWLHYSITRYGPGDRLMVVRDVTRLQHLEQMRRDFVANVSHELRTPLTVLVGYLETLLDADDGSQPRRQRALQQMQQQAERMQELLRDLLLLSRLESGNETQQQEVFDVSSGLQGLAQDARALSAERGHQIDLKISGNTLLHGNQAELQSAFSNLLFNAVKYTQNGGRIEMRWWQDEQGGHFEVSDNGPGIEERHLPRLTERFYRVDPSRNSATGGTGLGLAIVKHVLLRHDGNLEIHSTLGKGSRFSCHFPAQRLAQAPGTY